MMSVYLDRLGYAVETATGAEEAWAKAQANSDGFAVAVLDASMSGLPALDLALRLLSSDPGLRVVAASGYPVDMTALERAAPGRVVFLPKPFTPEMLAETVRRMIGPQEEL